MRFVSAVVLVLVMGTAVGAEQDCGAGERYLAMAHERAAASDYAEAADLATRALGVCSSYEANELLGEMLGHSLNRVDKARAVDAFLSANEFASSDRERARSMYQYARLLSRDGDPQNAYPLINAAKSLDPNDTEISALSTQIEQRVKNPTKDQIVRGLWNSLYKPMRVASISAGVSAKTTAAEPIPAPVRNDGPSVNIPINFETGTTMVDAQTRANIAILAGGLSDPAYSTQHFTFVGHADIRGSEPSNIVLSKRRAEAICQAVVALQPSLEGRIEVVGRGSSEPIDTGNNERAYRANRRLQVLLR
jgi:outer membrane protein OmpA-like peptidoglycan-associated protein